MRSLLYDLIAYQQHSAHLLAKALLQAADQYHDTFPDSEDPLGT